MLEGGERSHRGKRGRWENEKSSSSSVLKPATKSLFKKARDEEKTGVIKVSTPGVNTGIFYICKDPLCKRSTLTSSPLTMVSHNVSITTSSD